MSETIIQPLTELTPAYRALVESASAATKTAYAPYSRFHVGATLLFADGSSHSGANFENVSYGLSLCAETVAMASASAAGRLKEIVAIAIAAEGELAAAITGEFIAPCGRCRQVLAEAVNICGHDIEVLMLSRDGLRVRSTTARALLPLAFGL
ncbi:cytidine deaminase [Nevskia sp.]|uniref:cytidine deaminase n=1 Tax=Nevskia sp. TaxID=1929292 RepID=UPI0025F087F8|nr:cytidine deaminase [Nevskia sp.]